MTSILTNTAAMGAAYALAATQRSLAQVQRQASTGLRVASAEDDPAYWSIATSLRSRIGSLQAVNDDLSLTSAILGTAAAALSEITASVQDIDKLIIAAQAPGVDRALVSTQIVALQKHVIATANAASFNGVNLLVTKVVGTETISLTESYDVDEATDLSFGSLSSGSEAFDVTYEDELDQTRTLGAASSTSRQTTTLQYLDTITKTTTPDAVTLSSVPSDIVRSASPASGDATGYRTNLFPLGLNADGSIVSAAVDLGPLELFSSFSGTSSSTETDEYTDQDVVTTTPTKLSADQEPYISGVGDGLLGVVLSFALPATGSLTSLLTYVDGSVAGLIKAQAVVGDLQNAASLSSSFNTALIGSLTIGLGSLVDADMDEVSTRLAALQTQQQLGLQALSIANDNAALVLKLFGTA